MIYDDGGNDLYMSMTDPKGRKVVRYFHFRHIDSYFGFLYFVTAEKNGISLPKSKFSLQKNSLISKWTQVDAILSVTDNYETDNNDHLKKVLELLDKMGQFCIFPIFEGSVAIDFVRSKSSSI